MSLLFQVRGTQLNAFYATGEKEYGQAAGADAAVEASVLSGVFGSSLINLVNGGTAKALSYIGVNNFPSSVGRFTVLMRIVPGFTGNPAASQGLLCIGPGDGNNAAGLVLRIGTGSKLNVIIRGPNSSLILNDDSASDVPLTQDVPVDIWVTWDGTSGAGKVKVYAAANGNSPSEIGSLAPGASLSSRFLANVASMVVGQNPFGTTSNFKLNELAIWDTVEVPGDYGARAAFITASEFEGAVNTDPGIANVKLGTNYTFAGLAKTGTLESTDPGIANVRKDTAYVIESVSKTGTLVQNSFEQATLTGQAPSGAAATVLQITKGDQATLNLKAVNGPDLTAVNLTGATLTTYIKGDGGTVEITNSAHTIAPDQGADTGEFSLVVNEATSEELKLGLKKEIITKMVQGDSTIFFHGKKLLNVVTATPV